MGWRGNGYIPNEALVLDDIGVSIVGEKYDSAILSAGDGI